MVLTLLTSVKLRKLETWKYGRHESDVVIEIDGVLCSALSY
jgi:hypothetical protein